MAYYRCGPTAVGSRSSWAPVSSPDKPFDKGFDRPLSGHFDRIFNAFERTNAYECVSGTERVTAHGDVVVNRASSREQPDVNRASIPERDVVNRAGSVERDVANRMSSVEREVINRVSSLERADCALAAHAPVDDEEFYREKILYSQARQLYPLQEDLADWINKTIGITYLTGENFFDVVDNGVELCQLAAVIHDRARDAIDQGLIVGPVPQIRGRCWQRAARRSFFSRDNTENFITFCRELGVHENLLFESDDLVLHNQPRQVILCLLEVARLATRFNVEPPGLVQLEKEIAMEERDSGIDSAMWQFRDVSPLPHDKSAALVPPSSPDQSTKELQVVDNADAESTKSEGTVGSTDSDVPLKPTNELDKRVQLVTRLMERGCSCGAGAGRCSKLLKVRKVGEGRYNIAGRNVFIRLLKGRHMMVRVGGGWDTLEHFLSRHEPCQVRLVTQGRRDVLPVALPASEEGKLSRKQSSTSLSSKEAIPGTVSPVDSKASSISGKMSPVRKQSSTSLKESSIPGSVSPVDSKASSISGKMSPVRKQSSTSLASKESLIPGTVSPVDSKASSVSGKISPIASASEKSFPLERRSSTPKSSRLKSSLTLPLRTESEKKTPTRRQSAASLSMPATPAGRAVHTPAADHRKSFTPTLTNAPKKSRSMSLALAPRAQDNKPFCGTDRLNKKSYTRSNSAATTPTTVTAKTTRSQSLANTPVIETKRFPTNGLAKKTRSMSLANPVEFRPLSNKSISVNVSGALTQAAIEESIRLSLAASIADNTSSKKPFLHIKAKYRSPPPREVPPR